MALKEDIVKKEAPAESGLTRLTDEDERDLEIATLLGKRLIEDGGAEILSAAESSSDPGQVIGQFLMQLGSQMTEQLPEGLTLSPAIFLAEGGWLEQMSDFIQEEYDISREVMDRAEIYVGTSSQQMAEGQQAGQTPGQPPAPAAPVMPEGVA